MFYWNSTTDLGVIWQYICVSYKAFFFGIPFAGVGVAKFSKNTHMQCGSVQSEKLLCAECVGVPKLSVHKYSGGYGVKEEEIRPR